MKSILIVVVLLFFAEIVNCQDFSQLEVGSEIKYFTLKTVDNKEVSLEKLNKENNVVLIILRGYPGYQCPVCSRQVGGFLEISDDIKKLNARVLMVYPGPSVQMLEHAKEFSEDFNFPDHFDFVLDPDYSMINLYGLRWNSPKETAYPSTFIINKNGEIVFSKISQTHGGRASTEEILKVLGKN